MIFRCARFPEGSVPIRTTAGLVYFTDGAVEVIDHDLQAGLLALPAEFEVTSEGSVTPAPAPASSVATNGLSHAQRVRAWAKAHGLSVADKGRIPPHIYQKFRAAEQE